MLEFDDPQLKSLLVELDEQGRSKQGIDPAAGLESLMEMFRQQQSNSRLTVPAEQKLEFEKQVDLLGALIERNRNQVARRGT
jgi:hypothetical protein